MGAYPSPSKCVFTGLPTSDIGSDRASVDYFINVNGRNIRFWLSHDYRWTSYSFIKENYWIIKGEIFNDKWTYQDEFITEELITKIIQASDAPRTPKAKLDNLFLAVFKLQKRDGEEFAINDYLFDESFWSKLYFKDINECNFYLKTLDDYGLISAKLNQSGAVTSLSITFKGLNYQVELSESGIVSDNCFVAMSFGEGMNEIREAIKIAINETGFKPIIIDEIHVDSDKTINDEIIASIKKSKFCIADFTEQKDGVYFEAGYALGKGLKVIYTCKEEWFKQTHFDTNHFPHIIYKTPSELTHKLKMKIEAWVR